jgi:hypothetical protein
MVTSHQPITFNQKSGEPNGSQTTVALSRLSADETSKGFNIPNQINIIPNEILTDGILHRLIQPAICWSIVEISLFINFVLYVS